VTVTVLPQMELVEGGLGEQAVDVGADEETAFVALQAAQEVLKGVLPEDMLVVKESDHPPEVISLNVNPKPARRSSPADDILAVLLSLGGASKAAIRAAAAGGQASPPTNCHTALSRAIREPRLALAILGMHLWGPRTRKGAPNLRRWLHTERASALNEIVRSQGLRAPKLNARSEARLRFLADASVEQLEAAAGALDGPDPCSRLNSMTNDTHL